MEIKSTKQESISVRDNALVLIDQFKDMTAVNLDRFSQSDIQKCIRYLQNYCNSRGDL